MAAEIIYIGTYQISYLAASIDKNLAYTVFCIPGEFPVRILAWAPTVVTDASSSLPQSIQKNAEKVAQIMSPSTPFQIHYSLTIFRSMLHSLS